MLTSGLLAALMAFGIYALATPVAQKLTQNDIDAAVLHTLKKQPPERSRAAAAYDVISPSVVLVRRLGEDDEKDKGKSKDGKKQGETEQSKIKPELIKPELPKPERKPEAKDKNDPAPQEPKSAEKKDKTEKDKSEDAKKFSLRGIGTGVVFSDDGMIFTNLHVIAGAEKIGVVFYDGTESDVDVLNVQPENDLAILKAQTLPDDLYAATLRSTKGLQIGDEVLAVGFPFGIGPTATFGVVSGLRREHYSEEGQKNLIDLIQFDAAANPGNSGGPLVTREGDVVGIVTSIFNPTDEGFFVGIAFAVPIENAAAAAGVSPF
ncbi:MAG: trypsin-like peptidase domain-containing protein [Rhodospirillaceae bacterium]|nr:trypsin-like peptidase domain-containing protein [Rhodospirillaceae bacterium]